jgi:hypothetical protein
LVRCGDEAEAAVKSAGADIANIEADNKAQALRVQAEIPQNSILQDYHELDWGTQIDQKCNYLNTADGLMLALAQGAYGKTWRAEITQDVIYGDSTLVKDETSNESCGSVAISRRFENIWTRVENAMNQPR